MTPIEEKQKEIEDLEDRARYLQKVIKSYKEDMGKIKRLLDESTIELQAIKGGSWTHYSRIQIAREELDKLLLLEADKTARKAYFLEGETDEIVHKVTKKRIYLRSPGYSTTSMYNKDGTPVSEHVKKVIDIEKTFPDGFDN